MICFKTLSFQEEAPEDVEDEELHATHSRLVQVGEFEYSH